MAAIRIIKEVPRADRREAKNTAGRRKEYLGTGRGTHHAWNLLAAAARQITVETPSSDLSE